MPETPEKLFERVHEHVSNPKAQDRMSEALEALDGTRCTFCHKLFTPEELDDPGVTYIEVSSWVTGPKLQSPVLRSHTGKRAHKECIEKQIDGEAPDQEVLPGFDS